MHEIQKSLKQVNYDKRYNNLAMKLIHQGFNRRSIVTGHGVNGYEYPSYPEFPLTKWNIHDSIEDVCEQ